MQRGIAQAQEELRQLRETSQAEATHIAQQGTKVLASANPFADLVGGDVGGAVAPVAVAASPVTLGFGDSFDFSTTTADK